MADIQRLSDTDFHFTQLKNARLNTYGADVYNYNFAENITHKGYHQVFENDMVVWDGTKYIINDGFVNSYHHIMDAFYLEDVDNLSRDYPVLNRMYILSINYSWDNTINSVRGYGVSNKFKQLIKKDAHYLRLNVWLNWKNDNLLNDQDVLINSMKCYVYKSDDKVNWTKIQELPVTSANGYYSINTQVEIYDVNTSYFGIRIETPETDPVLPEFTEIKYIGEDSNDANSYIVYSRLPATSWALRLNIPNNIITSNSEYTIDWSNLLLFNGYHLDELSYVKFPFLGMYNVNCFVVYNLTGNGNDPIPSTNTSATLKVKNSNSYYLIDASPYLTPDIDNHFFVPGSLQGSLVMGIDLSQYFDININSNMTNVGINILGGYIDFHYLGDKLTYFSKLKYNSPDLIPPPQL